MPSHGALSKAGKVRSTTPKIEGKKRTSKSPKIHNRKRYYKRFTLARNIGQYKISRTSQRNRR